jgi:hypothetical protein
MITPLSYLTDEQLVGEVKRLAACERTTTADLVAHLAEMESRQLYLAAGFSSLFAYCREVLLLPEDATCNRTTAVRMVRAFPNVLPMLADGRLNLSTLRLIAPYLTADNHVTLLGEAAHKSKREVEEMMARWFPKPDVATSVRKLPAPPVAATPAAISSPRPTEAAAVAVAGGPAAQAAEPPSALRAASGGRPTRQPAVEPLAEDRYLIKFTASAAMLAKLRHAQDLLRHAVPNGDAAEIFDRALAVLVRELEKQKFAATERPRAIPRSRDDASRDVPAAVKRAVWLRDGGQCAFAGNGGHRCEARGFLELHHLSPYITSGEATVENIALRCRAHNQCESGLFFAPIRAAMSAHHSIRPGAG